MLKEEKKLRLFRVYPVLAVILFSAIIIGLGAGLLEGLVIFPALTVLIYAGIGPFMSAIELVQEFFEKEI